MSDLGSRAELEARLRGVASRLVVRQFARAGFAGVAGGGVGLGLGVLFLEVLPRLLFGAGGGPASIVACAVVGLAVSAGYVLRRFNVPDVHEAALALEARLEKDTGALAAMLRVQEDGAFYRPLLAQAQADYAVASCAPAPELISTPRLVAVPLVVLVSAVAFIWVLTVDVPEHRNTGGAESAGGATSWSPVDVGNGRSAEDKTAYRKAIGMTEVAASLNKAAATLRDRNASREDKTRALTDAQSALADGRSEVAGAQPIELPNELPANMTEQDALAEKISAAAAALAREAGRVTNGVDGTEDTGGGDVFGDPTSARDLVPFSKQLPVEATRQEALATQTPARRTMANRAIAELERIRNESR